MSVMILLVFVLRALQLPLEFCVNSLQPLNKVIHRGVGRISGHSYFAAGMMTVISEEGRNASGGVLSIVIDKFCEGKKLISVILVVAAIHS